MAKSSKKGGNAPASTSKAVIVSPPITRDAFPCRKPARLKSKKALKLWEESEQWKPVEYAVVRACIPPMWFETLRDGPKSYRSDPRTNSLQRTSPTVSINCLLTRKPKKSRLRRKK